jgi:purine-binding chemotaxis protein CheW
MAGAGKYICLKLAKDEFAIAAARVREVMGLQAIQGVSDAPEYVKGLINLRGKVVPVVDLRLKFGLPGVPPGRRTCIVVVQVQTAGGPFLTGLVVDSVHEVVEIMPAQIRNPPVLGEVEAPYLLGTARLKQKVRILLDTDHVLSPGELEGLRSMLPV